MSLKEIAKNIESLQEKIILIYAFNGTGKTRLSVNYKDKTKELNGNQHVGVYYNAFSEDLFIWDNDEGNDGENICLNIISSKLNSFHSLINEETIREKLEPYKVKYNFRFDDRDESGVSRPEDGFNKVYFYMEDNPEKNIKISRGEERIFVWCFFLALFEVEGWVNNQTQHIFIDDPVSSLDDNNIFITAVTIFDLIEKHFREKKLIITTHHIGLFSILHNWLKKGEKADQFKTRSGSNVKCYLLNQSNNISSLDKFEKSVFLYHLHLLKILKDAKDNDLLSGYHFVLLRQVLENIASFLGVGQFAYVLQQIGITKERIPNMINVLSHKKIFYYETDMISPENKVDMIDILEKLFIKYNFQVGG